MNYPDSWNLTDLFADRTAWEAQLSEIKRLAGNLAALRGHIADTPANLLKTLQISDALGEKASQNAVYAYCTLHTDMSLSSSKDLVGSLDIAMNEISEQIAFIEPEIMQYTYETYLDYCKALPELTLYNQSMRDLFERKEHLLDEQGETFLTRMADLGDSYRQVFEDLTVNDTATPEITSPDGETVSVTEAGYGPALQNPNRDFRREYFNALLGLYQGHINTLTSSYYGKVKADVYLAKSRNYPSARAAALAGNFIPEAVYDNLVSVVRENTAPLTKYISLRKKLLHIDDFHFYDFFVPLIPDCAQEYSYSQGAELVLKAAAPMGEEYTKKLEQALVNPWIDVYPHPNKQTGAYSTGAFGSHPYMLLNYTNTLEDVFTLMHELGHSMHTAYSNAAQPYVYADYSIFCAEVASTTNEQLLYHYLLQHTDSDALRAQLLAKHLDDIRSTFYRQTMFADFEMQTHALVEQGKPLLPDTLCGIHKQLNQDYYGSALLVDDTLGCEWARIPHYYRGFYVYQYATGISAAIAISRRILSGTPGAVEDYLKFLRGGSSQHPIELLRIAGVDMSSPQPILDTIAEFNSTLQQLEKYCADFS